MSRRDDELLECLNINISEEEIIMWVAKYYLPEEIFPARSLNEWAIENGYTKEK